MAFLQDRIINPIRTSKSAQVLAYGGLALFVIYVLLTRVTGNLPDVMGDELVYATAALHAPMSSAPIPDYLYYWVYSSTGVCGIGFYGCSQVLNTIFSLGAGLLVMVIARRFISQWASILIALVFVLGPLSASNSYFMPESMFYFFLALLLWHLTKQVEQRALGFWIQAGVYLALLSLVKPHALLLGAGIGTYLLVTQWGEKSGRFVRLVKEAGALLASTIVVKFGLGLVFAGPSGLTLFGGSYTGTLNGTLNGTASSSGVGTGPSVDTALGTSLSFIFSQIGVEVLAVVFLGALPLAAAVRYLWRSRKSVEANKPLADFSFLIVNTLAWMVILIAIFSNMTRLAGEDTANRIMLRYFEFLIPLLLITLVAGAEKGLTVKPAARWLLASVGGILTIVASTFITQTPTGLAGPRYNLQFVDSPMLKVLLGTYSNDATTGAPVYWMSIVVVIVTLIALALWAANPKWGAVTWVAAITPILLLLSNNAMVSNYAWRSNYTMASDTAGEFVRDSIPSDELKNLVIVAPSNSNKSELVAKFHINNADVQTTEINEGATYAAPAGDTNIKWELALGNVVLADKGYTVAQAGGIQLLRRDLGDIAILNNSSYHGSLLGATMGLDASNAQGMCATSTSIQLNLNRQVMAPDQIRLGLSAAGMGANQQYSIRIGETTQNVTLSNPQRPLNALLNATNNQASNQVYINLPNLQGVGLCVSYIEYIAKH